MKKVFDLLLVCTMVFGLTACGAAGTNEKVETIENPVTSERKSEAIETSAENQTTEATIENTETVVSENQADVEAKNSGTKTLVVYFSATGTTKKVAKTIADALSADIYEITPMEVYTDDDLNYNDKGSRSTKEQNDSFARPEISGMVENWEQYDTILIGFPIWWGEEPRIMDTFVESYDFTGKQVGVFCTSGGSSIGNSVKNLENYAGDGTWLGGSRLASEVSVNDILSWTADLGIAVE